MIKNKEDLEKEKDLRVLGNTYTVGKHDPCTAEAAACSFFVLRRHARKHGVRNFPNGRPAERPASMADQAHKDNTTTSYLRTYPERG